MSFEQEPDFIVTSCIFGIGGRRLGLILREYQTYSQAKAAHKGTLIQSKSAVLILQ